MWQYRHLINWADEVNRLAAEGWVVVSEENVTVVSQDWFMGQRFNDLHSISWCVTMKKEFPENASVV